MKRRELRMTDMRAQPGYLIRRAHQTATAAFAAATADLDITPLQFSALMAVKDNPYTDATSVSEMIYFDRTTVGHVLGRLEKKGLITRKSGTADGRMKLICLTVKGELVIREASQRVDEIAETILKPFSVSERTTLLKLLEKFAGRSSDRLIEKRQAPPPNAL